MTGERWKRIEEGGGRKVFLGSDEGGGQILPNLFLLACLCFVSQGVACVDGVTDE